MARSINKTYLLKLTSYAKEKAHGLGTTILIIFSLLLLIIGKVNEDSFSVFKSYFLDISSGFLNLIGKPVNSISDSFYKINNLVYLYSENENLKEENYSLIKWKDLALKLLAENEQLKKQLNSVSTNKERLITTKVISNSGGSYVKTITIDVGSNDGVKLGNPVINNWGMIGRIVELGKKLNTELKKTANMNAILSGNGELIEMPKSIIKTKLIQWAETDRMSSYWRDTEVARESGNPSDLDGYLFMKWVEWKNLQGYK